MLFIRISMDFTKNQLCIFFIKDYHKDVRNNFKQEITKIQEENRLHIKNKEDKLNLLQTEITNLTKTIESLQLKLDKEIAEHSRLAEELSVTNYQSKIWTSEKSTLERQVSYFEKLKNNFSGMYLSINLHFRFLSIKLN